MKKPPSTLKQAVAQLKPLLQHIEQPLSANREAFVVVPVEEVLRGFVLDRLRFQNAFRILLFAFPLTRGHRFLVLSDDAPLDNEWFPFNEVGSIDKVDNAVQSIALPWLAERNSLKKLVLATSPPVRSTIIGNPSRKGYYKSQMNSVVNYIYFLVANKSKISAISFIDEVVGQARAEDALACDDGRQVDSFTLSELNFLSSLLKSNEDAYECFLKYNKEATISWLGLNRSYL